MKKLFLLTMLIIPMFAFADDGKNSPVHQGTEITLNNDAVHAVTFEEQSIQVVVNAAEFVILLTEYDPCAGQPTGTCTCEVTDTTQGTLVEHKKVCTKYTQGPTHTPYVFYTGYWWTATP